MPDNRTSIEQSVMDKVRARGTLPEIEKGALDRDGYVRVIQKSGLARWCLLHGEAIAVPKLSVVEERVMTYLVDKLLAAEPGADTSYIEEDIEWMVCKLYGLTDEERMAVATPQQVGLPELTEEEEDTAMIRAIRQGEAREKDDEFLKHEEMMQKLLGQDES